MTLPVDLAVYSEHSPTRKAVQPGWNARVFNTKEVEEGSNIRTDMDTPGHAGTGVISLGPGVYHISGISNVTYNDLDPHPDGAGWNTKARPNGGYCRLRYAQDVNCGNEKAIVVGTISNANMVPSTLETYLDVPQYAQVVLEHQVGFEAAVVEGIYMQDDSANSPWHVFSRISIRRVLKTSTQYQRSALARVFDAAFGVYLATPRAYQRLYGSYLGVEPKFTPTSDEGSWAPASDPTLSRVLKSGVLRFGYSEGAPYVYHGGPPSSGLRGIDWELGNAITAIIRYQYSDLTSEKGLRAEWVKVEVPANGDPELGRFLVLVDGLKQGHFDIAMSGQANIGVDLDSPASTHEVDWTAATEILHTNILYSGRDGYDLSALVGSTRQRFIDVVKNWREVKVMCVKNPGPSPINSKALVDDINAVGGHATLDSTGTLPSITAALADQTIHFSVGDPVASAWIGNQPGFKGLNLDIAAGTQPLQSAQPVAAFTLPL
jgi:hypothetical protein